MPSFPNLPFAPAALETGQKDTLAPKGSDTCTESLITTLFTVSSTRLESIQVSSLGRGVRMSCREDGKLRCCQKDVCWKRLPAALAQFRPCTYLSSASLQDSAPAYPSCGPRGCSILRLALPHRCPESPRLPAPSDQVQPVRPSAAVRTSKSPLAHSSRTIPPTHRLFSPLSQKQTVSLPLRLDRVHFRPPAWPNPVTQSST